MRTNLVTITGILIFGILSGCAPKQPPHQVEMQTELPTPAQSNDQSGDPPKLDKIQPLAANPNDKSAQPPKDKIPTLSEVASQPATPKGAVVYTLVAGDTYWNIAKKKLGDPKRWREIEKLNPGVDRTKLLVGQSIYIPAK